MKRNTWYFTAQSDSLRDMCEQRVSHHMERLAWWREERRMADFSLRERGIDIREYAVSGGDRVEVVIDPTLTKRISECEAKIRQHLARCEEYAMWRDIIEGNGTRSYEFDHDDWTFFFAPTETDEFDA